MDQVTTAVDETSSPLVLEHQERTVDQGQIPDDGPSELEKHKQARGYTQPPAKTEPAAEPPPEAQPEPDKKPERWQDPDTGDHYDMRHKVARRIKTVLEDRGKERARAEAAERRVEELTKALIERGATPAQAEKKAEAMVEADPEPDPGDTTKYPEGQFDRGFIKDQARWAARQETKQFAQTSRQEQEQQVRQQAEAAAVGRWQQTVPEARKRYSDFDEVLARIPNTPENAPIVQLMMGSPVGNDVVYVLGTQPDAMEMYRRAPSAHDRMRLLHHIEAQLIQHHRATAAKQTQPRTTNAPAPITPVQSGPAAQVIDWSKDDPDQYARWKAQRANRR